MPPANGAYHPAIFVTDNKENTYAYSVSDTASSREEIDGILKKRWSDMKAALSRRDVDGAVQHFMKHARQRYRETFSALVDNLPGIASDMKDIEMIYLENDVAKCRTLRTHVINGKAAQIAYYVYFGRDADGVWRIDRF
jgi:hypothetical protein